MRKIFARTQNVKNFITMMNNLQNRADGVPGMALVYGEPGLGKTQAVLWWAAQNDAVLCSMDDLELYGEEIYRIGFGEAVEKGLLSDYKVLVLTLSENDIPQALQNAIADNDSEINTDDASKLIGCINALSKQVLGDEGIIKETDPEPMRRAVAFCANIKDSEKITRIFNNFWQLSNINVIASKDKNEYYYCYICNGIIILLHDTIYLK